MRVIICGGRKWCELKYSYYVLDFINKKLHNITTVIQGGAFGADALAAHWAFDRKIECLEYPADWDRYGKSAGMIRNKQMLEEKPDLIIAFPGGKGTANMINIARKANIKIMEIDMSELVQRIKLEQLEARKNKDSVKASLLTTLLGEYEVLSKNSLSMSAEETMMMLIKKFLKNISITMESRSNEELVLEKEILESFLPAQLTREKLEMIVGSYMSAGHNDKPSLMKQLKADYAGAYDGRMANEVITEMLG